MRPRERRETGEQDLFRSPPTLLALGLDSVATHNDLSTVPIIVRSNAPELSNNIIQKALAFGRQQSGTVVNSER